MHTWQRTQNIVSLSDYLKILKCFLVFALDSRQSSVTDHIFEATINNTAFSHSVCMHKLNNTSPCLVSRLLAASYKSARLISSIFKQCLRVLALTLNFGKVDDFFIL